MRSSRGVADDVQRCSLLLSQSQMGVVVVLISILPWLHSWRTRYLQGHGWHHTVVPGTCCAIGPVAATILADKVAVYQRRDDTSWLPALRLSGEAKTIVAFANVLDPDSQPHGRQQP